MKLTVQNDFAVVSCAQGIADGDGCLAQQEKLKNFAEIDVDGIDRAFEQADAAHVIKSKYDNGLTVSKMEVPAPMSSWGAIAPMDSEHFVDAHIDCTDDEHEAHQHETSDDSKDRDNDMKSKCDDGLPVPRMELVVQEDVAEDANTAQAVEVSEHKELDEETDKFKCTLCDLDKLESFFSKNQMKKIALGNNGKCKLCISKTYPVRKIGGTVRCMDSQGHESCTDVESGSNSVEDAQQIYDIDETDLWNVGRRYEARNGLMRLSTEFGFELIDEFDVDGWFNEQYCVRDYEGRE